MENIAKKFEHLFEVISTDEFLKMRSLGGEIPFFISSFDPKQQNEIDKAFKGLKNKLEKTGITVLELNLYDISMDIIKQELGEEEIFELEQQMDKSEFKEALQSILDINAVLIPKIRTIIEAKDAKVYFLTGIGLVFPFIRSHTILNNLQNVAKKAPTIAFFPGNYNGQSLELFTLLKDDNYYRAFNIEHYQIKR